MRITIDTHGYDLVARDEEGAVLACRKTNCNPAALRQIILDAERKGEIDWENSRVAKPDALIGSMHTKDGNPD